MHFVTDQHVDLRQLCFVLEHVLAVSDNDLSSRIECFFALQPSCKLCDLSWIIAVVNQVFVELDDELLVWD